jgi:hypothetical protein
METTEQSKPKLETEERKKSKRHWSTVLVGHVVHHFRDPGSTPSAAIVTAVGNYGIVAIGIFYPGMHNCDPVDGVPHISDHRDRPIDAEIGYWDFVDA